MSRDIQLCREDIILCCERVARYIQGHKKEQFMANQMAFDAVVRNINVIGEAVKHVPEALRKQKAHVPWNKIIEARDHIAHGHFDIDKSIIWEFATHVLPEVLIHIKDPSGASPN